MRERVLVRHFLRRFLDHDLLSANAEPRELIGVLGGGLISLSLFLAVLLAVKYQFNMFLPPGLTSIAGLDDRFLLLAGAMLVMALLAVAEWDALSLDPRDTAVLGHLPIPRREIVGAKFQAVAVLAAAVAMAWTVPPVLLRAVALPIRLPVTWVGVMQLMAALAVASLAAASFGFLAVLGCREVLRAVCGGARFARVSAAVQGVLIVASLTAALLLPTVYGGVANRWLADSATAPRVTPPLWFLGLHETLGGSVLDRLPRSAPGRLYAVSEPKASARYRALQPQFAELARRAVAGLVLVAVFAVAACAWNTRQLPTENNLATRPRRRSPVVAWALAHGIAPSPAARAGFDFAVQTIWRSIPHRVGMAAAAAVGLAAVLATTREVTAGEVATMPLAILAAQTMVLTAVVLGFRRAVRLPADARATWIFAMCWTGDAARYLSGVKRAGALALLLPALGVLSVWHAGLLGPRAALWHAALGAALALVLLEVAFFDYRGIPFASAHAAIGDLQTTGFAIVIATVALSWTLAGVERALFDGWRGYALLVAVLIALAGGLRALDAARRRAEGRDPLAPGVDFGAETLHATPRLDLTP